MVYMCVYGGNTSYCMPCVISEQCIYLSVHLSTICLYIDLSINLSIYLTIHISIYPSIYLLIYIYIYVCVTNCLVVVQICDEGVVTDRINHVDLHRCVKACMCIIYGGYSIFIHNTSTACMHSYIHDSCIYQSESIYI